VQKLKAPAISGQYTGWRKSHLALDI